MLDSFNDMNQGGSIEDMEDLMGGNTRYKLVKRAISDTDSGDGDTDYETLIEFNYDENEDDDDYTTVARVYNPESKEMVENELLTKLFAQHEEQAEIYPSISIKMCIRDRCTPPPASGTVRHTARNSQSPFSLAPPTPL